MNRKMKNMLTFILLLFSGFLFSQSPGTPDIQFQSDFRITNAVNGTIDTVVISGYVNECAGRFANSDIAIGDSIYVLEGSDLLVFGIVTTRTISLGIATFKAIDFGGAAILPSNGQAAIFRPTTNYQFPGDICGLNPNLQQYITARFMMRLDDILATKADSLNVVQDSIILLFANDVEIGRDTVASGANLGSIPPADAITATDELIWADSTISWQKVVNQARDSLQADTVFAINTAVTSATITGLIKQNRKDVHLFLTMTSAETQNEAITLPNVSTLTGKEGLKLTISVKDSDADFDYYVLPNVTSNLPELILNNGRNANRYYFDAEETAVFILTRNSSGLIWKLESTTSDDLNPQTDNMINAATDFKNKRFIRGSTVRTNLGAEYEIVNVPVSGYNSNNPDSAFVYVVKDKVPWGRNLATGSDQLHSQTYWIRPGADIQVLQDFTPSPTGDMTAERLVMSGLNELWSTIIGNTLAGDKVTVSFWAKQGIASSNDNVTLSLYLPVDNTVSVNITGISKYWKRYSTTLTADANTTNERVSIKMNGDEFDSLDMTNVLIEFGTAVTDYKRTETTTTTEGILYAVYKASPGYVELDKVFQRKKDYQHIQDALNYAVTQKQKTVFCEKDREITAKIDIPTGANLMGTYGGGAQGSDYTNKGTLFKLNLNNAATNAFEFTGGTYKEGNTIEGIIMMPVSAGRSAIKTGQGFFQNISKVSIVNYAASTEHLSYGIDIAGGTLSTVMDRLQIRHCSVAGILYGGSVLNTLSNSLILNCEVGIDVTGGSLSLYNTWLEDLDSCAIIFNSSTSELNVTNSYTEGVPSSGGGGTANVFYVKAAGSVNLNSVVLNGEGNDNILLSLENVKAANITGCKFVNGSYGLKTISTTGNVNLIGNTSSVTMPPVSYVNIYDSTRIVIIGHNDINANEDYNNIIHKLETDDAYIDISEIDSSFIHSPTINEELLLNAPTVKNRNENLVEGSEQIQHGVNSWVNLGTSLTITQNDTIAPDGTTTAEKMAYLSGLGQFWYNTPTETLITGEWYAVSFYVANSSFASLTVEMGDVSANGIAVPLDYKSNAWIRYHCVIQHTNATNLIDFVFNGSAGQYCHIWGIQVERNRRIGEYIKTTGTIKTDAIINPSFNISEGDTLEFDGDVSLQSAIIDSTGSAGILGEQMTSTGDGWTWESAAPVLDHGALTGLGDDDHAQYALLAGRAGSQVLNGGTAANEDLTLNGTSNGTKTSSYVILQPSGGSVGIGTSVPLRLLDISAATPYSRLTNTTSLSAWEGVEVAALEFYTADLSSPGNVAVISAIGGAGSTGYAYGDLAFFTKNNSGILEKMRITNAGFLGIGTSSPDRLFHTEVSDAVTNAVTFAQRLTHISSGTVATSFGTGSEYELENASGTNRVAASEEVTYSDAVNATEDATYTLKLISAGTLTTVSRNLSNGALKFGSAATGSEFYPYAGVFPSIPDVAGTNISFFNYNTSETGLAAFAFSGSDITATTSTSTEVYINRTFAPTSGTGKHNSLTILPIINQTGGATGVTKGLLVDPVLTAATDFIGIEVTNGAMEFPILTVTTTTHTAGNSFNILADDTTAGAPITITLPAAAGKTGRMYTVKKLGTTGNVIIDGSGAETIDGATTYTLTTQWESVTIACDGTAWFIL